MSNPTKIMPSVIYGTKTRNWEEWHRCLDALLSGREQEAKQLLGDLFADDCEFKPPTYFKTRRGKEFTVMALLGVGRLFTEFQYVREFIGDNDLALEFTTKCGTNGPVLHGIDLIKFNAQGKITEMAVLARPPSAVKVLAEHQAKFMKEFAAKL